MSLLDRGAHRPVSLLICAALAGAALSHSAQAQVSIVTPGVAVTQDFDTLANTAGSTTNTALPTGWAMTETGGGARDNEQYAVDTGGSNTGDTYSYGATAATDRAFGSLRSGTLIATFGAQFTNNTGAAIGQLDIAYNGEEWRLGTTARQDRIDFQYSLDATSLTTGTWVDFDTLDFSTPETGTVGAKDGNNGTNRTAKADSITALSIANGASFWIRWNDADASSADDGLAVDDFSLTALGVGDPAPTVTGVTPANATTNVAVGSSIAITFSEAVTVAAGSFTLQCPDTADIPFTLTGTSPGTAFTLDPVADLPFDTVCEVVVLAAGVSDDDAVDPPDNMAADHTVTFTTESLDPDMSIDDPSIVEGNAGTTQLVFTVNLTTAAGPTGVTFDVATSNGTATAGSDYVALTSAGSIAAGATSTTVSVDITGDTLGEVDETFVVTLSNAVDATIVDATGTGTITNDDRYFVWQVQGAGSCSPLLAPTPCNQAADVAGSAVDVRASIVTAVGPNGFFIQTPNNESDGNALTSDGIYVLGNSAVAVGDLVEVSGTVREFFGLTEISPATSVVVINGDNALPTAVEFSDAQDRPSKNPAALSCPGTGPGGANNVDTNFECFEGMLVNIVDGITTTGNQFFGSDNYAEVHVGTRGARAYRDQGTRFPALPAPAASEAGQWDFNPEFLELDADALGAFANPFEIVGGVDFSGQGVIAYDFSDYEFWPVAGEYPAGVERFTLDTADNVLPRPARARASDEELTIGSFNAWRLCDIIDDIGTGEIAFTCDDEFIEPGGQPAYDNKLTKVSAYIRTVLNSPDVLGMEEVEKLDVLEDLADVIEADGGPVYQPFLIEGHDPGGIDVGFMVRTDRIVNPTVEQLRGDEQWNDPQGAGPLHDRPPLLLRAEFNGNPGHPLQFAVMVNHTRSFGTGDRVHGKRFLQAKAIAEEVQAYQTNVVNALRPLILVGDHNAYQFTDGFTDPIGLITGAYNDESNGCNIPAVTDCKIDGVADAANPDAVQLVDPPLLKSVDVMAALDADEVYSYIFTETVNPVWGQNRDLPTSQVIDHMLLTETAQPLLVDFAYGRANTDASRNGFNTGTAPDGLGGTHADPAIGSSDHDGFVGYFDTTCTGDLTADADADQVCDIVDNCPGTANNNQLDTDGDGAGDACDPNLPPTISDTGNQSTAEDTALQVDFTIGDVDGALTCASVTGSSDTQSVVDDAQIVISGTAPDCTATITPVADAVGTATIELLVTDAASAAVGDSFVLTVTPVNDVPSFTLAANNTVTEDFGTRSVPGFASAISAGAANEAGQVLTFNLTGNTNAALFAAAPAIAANGTLTYTPAANLSGTATITVTLSDNGGGTDTSAPQTFTITVTAQPDAPTFVNDPYAFTVTAGASNGTVIGTVSATDIDAGDTLTYSIQTSSTPGAVTINPATGVITVANGTLVTVSGSPILLTVRVVDSTNRADAANVTITVNPQPGIQIFANGFEN